MAARPRRGSGDQGRAGQRRTPRQDAEPHRSGHSTGRGRGPFAAPRWSGAPRGVRHHLPRWRHLASPQAAGHTAGQPPPPTIALATPAPSPTRGLAGEDL